jgi:hypothetical protein
MKIKPKIPSKPEIQDSKPKIQTKPEIQRKARATGNKKKKKQRRMEPRAVGATRKQLEGPPEEAEIAREAIREARVWRRGPILRISSTQKSETPTATRSSVDSGEELDHDGESSGEAC